MPALAFDRTIRKVPILNKPFIEKNKNQTLLYKNKIAVLNFEFNGCPSCQEKHSFFEKLASKYNNNDRIIFMSFTNGELTSRKQFDKAHLGKKNSSNILYVYDVNGEISNKFKAESFPAEIILDRDGKPKRNLVGFNADMSISYVRKSTKLLNNLIISGDE